MPLKTLDDVPSFCTLCDFLHSGDPRILVSVWKLPTELVSLFKTHLHVFQGSQAEIILNALKSQPTKPNFVYLIMKFPS
jgi:hypothetical protein